VKTRQTLKVVFHLVDARHGLLQADEECLNILTELPDRVAYVIVLTKVDKLGGGVNRDFINKIDREIKSRRSGNDSTHPLYFHHHYIVIIVRSTYIYIVNIVRHQSGRC
jgi:GTP-binding protein EngB required for normal cell division